MSLSLLYFVKCEEWNHFLPFVSELIQQGQKQINFFTGSDFPDSLQKGVVIRCYIKGNLRAIRCSVSAMKWRIPTKGFHIMS